METHKNITRTKNDLKRIQRLNLLFMYCVSNADDDGSCKRRHFCGNIFTLNSMRVSVLFHPEVFKQHRHESVLRQILRISNHLTLSAPARVSNAFGDSVHLMLLNVRNSLPNDLLRSQLSFHTYIHSSKTNK